MTDTVQENILNEEGLVARPDLQCLYNITSRDDCREQLGFSRYNYERIVQNPEIYIPLKTVIVFIILALFVFVIIWLIRKNK